MNDFSAAELAQARAAAEEVQREFEEWGAWLQSPEGRAWGDQVLQECRAMAEEFEQEVQAGRFNLTPAELEQLQRDGVFVSHRKKGVDK